jgi:hypothetical protein
MEEISSFELNCCYSGNSIDGDSDKTEEAWRVLMMAAPWNNLLEEF